MSIGTRTQQLSSNRIAAIHKVGNSHVISWPQPSVAVAVEEDVARYVRVIGTSGVPDTPIENNSRTRWHTNRRCAVRVQGFVLGKLQSVLEVSSGEDIEIPSSHFRRITQKVCDLDGNPWSRMCFEIFV